MARRRKKSKLSAMLILLVALAGAVYSMLALSDELDLPFPSLEDVEVYLSGGGKTGTEYDCAVHFIDVGQGDCELILCGGQAVLIDAGENDQGAVVVDYLEALGIERIDLLIATHPHSDHIGGLDTVIDSMEIGKIWMPRLPDEMVPTTRTYTDMLESIAAKGLKITPAQPGLTYELGEGVLTVLGPRQEYDDLNNTSLVCRLDVGEHSFLFTGDMEEPVEKDLLESGADLRADVLKAGHHGSSTSTCPEFYQAVDPQICVISCGEGNSYGHPQQVTLETMASNGAGVYRTDFQGSIVIGIANGAWEITWERGKDAA